MEHPFFPATTTRAEALRWLSISEKLLSTRDLMGSKSFATRARDADPTLSQADQILAVADTLLAGDMRIGNNQQDLYAILRLTPQQGRDAELVASQYRNLTLLLNPQKNMFPLAEQAFRLVLEAWSVLSNPSRKLMYDRELAFYLQPQPEPQHQHQHPHPHQHQHQIDQFGTPIPPMHQNFNFFGGSTSSTSVAQPSQPQPSHFPRVHVSSTPQVDPLASGSTRESPSFMNFSTGFNIAFGTGSGTKPINETVNKLPQEDYSTFGSNVSAEAAPEPTPVHGNNEPEHMRDNYSNVGNKSSENLGDHLNERLEEVEVEEEEDMEGVDEEEEDGAGVPVNDSGFTIWTACPYCYYMYEYPGVYQDCVLRCQNCKSAFQAVSIPSPPPIEDGQEGYFCCWGFLPMGFSMEHWEKNKGSASTWTPFSPMFTTPVGNTRRKNSGPRVYVDDDEVFVELSESSGSDDDWNRNTERRKKKAKTVRRKSGSGTGMGTPGRIAKKAQVDKDKNVSAQDGGVGMGVENGDQPEGGESSKKVSGSNARKQPGRAAKNFGKLDLNVECSNEAEEAAPRGANQGSGPTRGEDENIEGIGFFEGLDEFLSSLPILNVVGEDKVVKA